MNSIANFTVFYAWQSDTSKKYNQRLIQHALEDAADRINTGGEFPFQVVIDHDTKGIPGLCDIPATILKKN